MYPNMSDRPDFRAELGDQIKDAAETEQQREWDVAKKIENIEDTAEQTRTYQESRSRLQQPIAEQVYSDVQAFVEFATENSMTPFTEVPTGIEKYVVGQEGFFIKRDVLRAGLTTANYWIVFMEGSSQSSSQDNVSHDSSYLYDNITNEEGGATLLERAILADASGGLYLWGTGSSSSAWQTHDYPYIKYDIDGMKEKLSRYSVSLLSRTNANDLNSIVRPAETNDLVPLRSINPDQEDITAQPLVLAFQTAMKEALASYIRRQNFDKVVEYPKVGDN